jgi:hypothetical protein
MKHRTSLSHTKVSVQVRGFVCEYFHGEEFLAHRPTPKQEDYLLSAVRDCLFNIFTATIRIGGRSSIRNLRTRHAMVTGNHLSHGGTPLITLIGPTYHTEGPTYHIERPTYRMNGPTYHMGDPLITWGTHLSHGWTRISHEGTHLSHGGTRLSHERAHLSHRGTRLSHRWTNLSQRGTHLSHGRPTYHMDGPAYHMGDPLITQRDPRITQRGPLITQIDPLITQRDPLITWRDPLIIYRFVRLKDISTFPSHLLAFVLIIFAGNLRF